MIIEFKTQKLQKTCNSSKEIIKKWGAQNGAKIMQRLSELRAANALEEISHLPPPRLHQLSNDKDEILAVDIKQPYRIIFEVNNKPFPRKPDGGIDRSKVTKILIISAMDYH